jgi:hypothetical protein
MRIGTDGVMKLVIDNVTASHCDRATKIMKKVVELFGPSTYVTLHWDVYRQYLDIELDKEITATHIQRIIHIVGQNNFYIIGQNEKPRFRINIDNSILDRIDNGKYMGI